MAINNTFPGVYISVVDQSFQTTITSRFRGGLIGVAEKGPFDTAVSVRSITEFAQNFGRSISGQYLANVAAVVSGVSDGLSIVRVGRRYENLTAGNASGTQGTYTIYTPQANLFSPNDYLRITQRGKATTVNAKVLTVFSDHLDFISTGAEAVSLAETYASAAIDKSPVANAANEAEGFLDSLIYDTVPLGTLSLDGDKNAFEFTVTGGTASSFISVGDVLKITQTNKATTQEVMVKEVRADNKVFLETSPRADVGYQSLPLQDSYQSAGTTPAQIFKALLNTPPISNPSLVSYQKIRSLQVLANSAGTWANSDGRTTGVVVRVGPGSAPDSKKILVFLNSGQVETIDNLTFSDPNDVNYVTTRINDRSSFINVVVLTGTPPANTRDPWNFQISESLNITGLDKGFNGENASVDDFIGTIDPADDRPTGLKIFEEDNDNLQVAVIAAPGKSDTGIGQEMARICSVINAVGVFDVPAGLNSREAVDWHNGAGLFTGNTRIDSPYLAVYWNWLTVVDPFTGGQIQVPPTFGALRAMATTFDRFKPWFAAAGEIRGLIPEALAVEFPRISQNAKNAMYGNGNSVNPILLNRNTITVFGDRTLQRRESKLTAIHNVILVNYVVRGLAEIGRQFVFDPNDAVLLTQISSLFATFLDSVRAERGIEEYRLVMDNSNNNAATRNQREVICDLSIIPTDTMERLFINATVRESGAQLNAVT